MTSPHDMIEKTSEFLEAYVGSEVAEFLRGLSENDLRTLHFHLTHGLCDGSALREDVLRRNPVLPGDDASLWIRSVLEDILAAAGDE